MLYEHKSIIDTDHTPADSEQAGQAVVVSGPARPVAGFPGTVADPLRKEAAGILNCNSPREFMAGVAAGNQRMGNRAFMRWVGELRSRERDGGSHADAARDGRARQTAYPDARPGPLQLMSKKKKKKAEPETQQETPPDSGATAGARVEATPEAPVLTEQAATPKQGASGAAAGVVEKKKKKKSRVQVALNTLRSEGLEVFREYMEAEIGEAELLRTLVERINRAQDLTGVSSDALEVIREHMRRLDPEALPGEEQPVEKAVAAPVKTQLSMTESVLFEACAKGDLSFIRRKTGHRNFDINVVSQYGTLLAVAAISGHAGIVRELLSRPGIDVNQAGQHELTPLYLATFKGSVEAVRLLLDARGVNANLAAPDGSTPLGVAAFYGHEEIVRLLLAVPNIKVNVRDESGATALYFAVQQGHVEIVKLLQAARGVNVNFTAVSDATPLVVAANFGWEKIVELLLAAPYIKLNARKDDGATALFCAAQFGFPRIVELLIRHGANVNLPLYQGTTPLAVATEHGCIEVVRLLLQAPEIRVNQATENNVTPLYIAAHYGHKDIVRVLLRKGADPNLASDDAVSPLHVACLRGDTAITRMLLNREADSNMRVLTSEGEGCTPYELARLGNHRDIMNMLAAHWRALAARLDALFPGLQTEQSPSPVDTAADSQPALETLSPLEQGKQSLVREILCKLDEDTLEPLEGIRMLVDVQKSDSVDALCAIYNHLAGIERQRQRARRGRGRRQAFAIGPGAAAPAPEVEPRYAVGAGRELDAEGIEDEIRHYLSQRYHRFVSQAVNNMEFGRGKPTSGYPGLWHVSAGIPGVGSCSVFYYTDATGKRMRIVGVGRHVGRAAYRLEYAVEELGGVGRILRIA